MILSKKSCPNEKGFHPTGGVKLSHFILTFEAQDEKVVSMILSPWYDPP